MPSSAIWGADVRQVFSDAVAVWHFSGIGSFDGKNPLRVHGAVKLGVELQGVEREASQVRGGDGKAAEFSGGWLEVGQGGDGRLNLKGNAMTLLLRLRNYSGKWSSSQLFCQDDGHGRLVYNLFIKSDRLGFNVGFGGQTHSASQSAMTFELPGIGFEFGGKDQSLPAGPEQWHDVITRYDGNELVIFVDGIVLARTEASGSLWQGNTEPVIIGSSGFKGLMDHAALWQRGLSDDEIIALSGGEEALKSRREARPKQIEAKIGREGLTLADQIRGARELRQRLWNDPQRPGYHLMPPEGFWNDINGTIYRKGRYHVFFLGRSAPELETVLSGKDTDRARETWLHASSADLVHWILHPPALVPVFDGSMPGGLYSGDMMDNMPIPTIIVHVPGQGTCLYTAEDDELIHWKPHPNNPVIPITNAPPEAAIFDPCGWKEGDIYYALIGNKNKTPGYEGDSTSLFRSRDLAHWEYRGPFYKSERRWTPESQDCACPDFFPLGNKYLLLSHVHRPWNHLQYYIGRFDKQAERFLPESHGYMSWPGGQLCAPETLLDGKGRRIFWGWIMEAGPHDSAWDSVATLPRVLTLAQDDTLRIEPAPELEVLRCNPRHRENLTVSGDVALNEVRGDCLEISAVIEPGDAKQFGLKVRCSPQGDEQTVIVYSTSEKTLKVELAKSSPNAKYTWGKSVVTEQAAPLELKAGEPLRLRVFLDRSVLEVYANGRQCITQRIYPSRADSLGVALVTRGGSAKVRSVDAWDMSPVNSW